MAPGGDKPQGVLALLSTRQDLILPIVLVSSVLIILVPLPPALMDVAFGAEHHRRRDHVANDDLRAYATGIQHFPFVAVGNDTGTTCAERRQHPTDPHSCGQRWRSRRRTRDPSFRSICHRRQADRRFDPVRDHRGDPVSGHHQGGHADQRSRRPVCLGWNAGATNGNRRRPERRHHRRKRGTESPQRNHSTGRLLWARWTVPASSFAATPLPAS